VNEVRYEVIAIAGSGPIKLGRSASANMKKITPTECLAIFGCISIPPPSRFTANNKNKLVDVAFTITVTSSLPYPLCAPLRRVIVGTALCVGPRNTARLSTGRPENNTRPPRE
jgi:hypothetical protein